jgi:hypothetical protein
LDAGEVDDGDDVGGEGAGEGLAAEVVQHELLVGWPEAEPDGQAAVASRPRRHPASTAASSSLRPHLRRLRHGHTHNPTEGSKQSNKISLSGAG